MSNLPVIAQPNRTTVPSKTDEIVRSRRILRRALTGASSREQTLLQPHSGKSGIRYESRKFGINCYPGAMAHILHPTYYLTLFTRQWNETPQNSRRFREGSGHSVSG